MQEKAAAQLVVPNVTPGVTTGVTTGVASKREAGDGGEIVTERDR